MSEGLTCYEQDEELCSDEMCLRTGCRLRNDRLRTEQQMPARIWARNPNGKCVVSFTIGDFDYKTPYIRSDIAERMADALKALVSDIEDYERTNNLSPSPGKTDCWQSVTHAKAALSAFKDSAQDRGAS